MDEIKEYTEKIFEDIKHIDENVNEYWLARELGKILKYGEYRNFLPSIKKAIISFQNSDSSKSVVTLGQTYFAIQTRNLV